MFRSVLLPVTAAVLAFGGGLGTAAAEASQDPAPGDTTAYLIGACWDPSQPVDQRPATLVYGCDKSSVMEDMTWTAWGADGAEGTGIDSAVECQPNCQFQPMWTGRYSRPITRSRLTQPVGAPCIAAPS